MDLPALGVQLAIVMGLAIWARKAGALDRVGMMTAIVVGFLLVFGGGWKWLFLATFFLFLAFQFTKFKYAQKEALGSAERNLGARGWSNILANGGVPSLAAVLEGTIGGGVFAAAFVGALATSAADTLATEVGLLSRTPPRLLTNLRKIVPPGTSGGVTGLGLAAGGLVALIMGVLAGLLNIGESPVKFVLIGALVGSVGSIIDSLLGATVQKRYRCSSCSVLTERPSHHGTRTLKIAGLRFIDNNMVNLLSAALGSLIAVALYLYL